MLLAVDVAVIMARVALAQKDVAAAFAVPPETVAVFIGNSHTGCTFTEAPEFHNRVVWRSATGFMLHYLRFLELERRGAFDGSVKACVVDCNASDEYPNDWQVRVLICAFPPQAELREKKMLPL